MKVDLGTCAVCGAKNSKFVEACYKCNAPLPWAPNYVAPTSNSAPDSVPAPQPTPEPQTTPSPTLQVPPPPADQGTPTVVIPPPLNVSPAVSEPEKAPLRVPEQVAENMKKRVAVPTWAIAALAIGCLTLGMGMVYLFGNSSPRATAVPADIPDAVPVASPSPVATPGATAAATPAVVVVAPTSVPTPAPNPAATPAGPSAVVPAPTGAAPEANLPTPATRVGPLFDDLWKNTHSGTPAQQEAYWQSVQGTLVTWRGEFVSLGSNPNGPLVVRCKSGSGVALVTVELDENATTVQPQPKQSIVVEGQLQSRSSDGYTLTSGRVK